MADSILRGGAWWQRREDGVWLRWNDVTSAWEEQDTAPPAENRAGAARFQSPRQLGNIAILLLALTAVLHAIGIVSSVAEYMLLQKAETSGITFAEANANDDRQAMIGMAQLVMVVVTGIAFIAWFHRCYKNLLALGAPMRFGTGWAIGAWFVPILFLWRPKQIADEIWHGSDPTAPASLGDTRGEPVGPVLTWWWVTYIVYALSGRITQVRSGSPGVAPTLDDLQWTSVLLIANDAVGLVAAILAVYVVHHITHRQQTRAQRFDVPVA